MVKTIAKTICILMIFKKCICLFFHPPHSLPFSYTKKILSCPCYKLFHCTLKLKTPQLLVMQEPRDKNQFKTIV